LTWLNDLGYREARETPSAHERHCNKDLLIAQEDDNDKSIFLYCDVCHEIWRVGQYTQSMATRRLLVATAERVYQHANR
jgi:hypothetical protein